MFEFLSVSATCPPTLWCSFSPSIILVHVLCSVRSWVHGKINQIPDLLGLRNFPHPLPSEPATSFASTGCVADPPLSLKAPLKVSSSRGPSFTPSSPHQVLCTLTTHHGSLFTQLRRCAIICLLRSLSLQMGGSIRVETFSIQRWHGVTTLKALVSISTNE